MCWGGVRLRGPQQQHTAHRTPHTAHRTSHTVYRTPHTTHHTPHITHHPPKTCMLHPRQNIDSSATGQSTELRAHLRGSYGRDGGAGVTRGGSGVVPGRGGGGGAGFGVVVTGWGWGLSRCGVNCRKRLDRSGRWHTSCGPQIESGRVSRRRLAPARCGTPLQYVDA